MNGGVAFARRLRHHLYARIENFFAGQNQFRFAAAEQLWEQLTKIFVHLIVGVHQHIARLFINFLDRIFQRGHRVRQIRRLRGEESLALLRDFQLVQRRQVDRAQGIDLIVQSGNFRLQHRGARAVGERSAQLFAGLLDIHFGLAQLLGKLLLIQARGLLG